MRDDDFLAYDPKNNIEVLANLESIYCGQVSKEEDGTKLPNGIGIMIPFANNNHKSKVYEGKFHNGKI